MLQTGALLVAGLASTSAGYWWAVPLLCLGAVANPAWSAIASHFRWGNTMSKAAFLNGAAIDSLAEPRRRHRPGSLRRGLRSLGRGRRDHLHGRRAVLPPAAGAMAASSPPSSPTGRRARPRAARRRSCSASGLRQDPDHLAVRAEWHRRTPASRRGLKKTAVAAHPGQRLVAVCGLEDRAWLAKHRDDLSARRHAGGRTARKPTARARPGRRRIRRVSASRRCMPKRPSCAQLSSPSAWLRHASRQAGPVSLALDVGARQPQHLVQAVEARLERTPCSLSRAMQPYRWSPRSTASVPARRAS